MKSPRPASLGAAVVQPAQRFIGKATRTTGRIAPT